MRAGRMVRRLLVYLLVAVVIAALVVFAMISYVPSSYRWRHRSPEEQKIARNAFVKHIGEGFGNRIGRARVGEVFTWTLTAEQANDYLASLDAIASLGSLDEDEPVYALAAMERAGLADPAVAMDDGLLTVMAKVRKYGKVFSIDLALEFDDAGDLGIRIAGMRIGAMPVPQAILEDRVQQARSRLSAQLARAERAQDARLGAVDLSQLAGLMRESLSMLTGESVRPVLRYKLFGTTHRAQVRRIEIDEGKLTLHCEKLPFKRD